MDALTLQQLLDPSILITACAIAALGAFVKGAVGFAMPMIMISFLSAFLPAHTALAALILPTLLTNVVQALRQGPEAAVESVRKHGRFMVVGGSCLVVSAQLLPYLAPGLMLLVLGGLITAFAVSRLAGRQLTLNDATKTRAEVLMGAFAGLVGGMTGVWGPQTVAYLVALKTPKYEMMRVQGVVFGMGAVLLAVAHLNTGILNKDTAVFSAILIVPAILGQRLGRSLTDRMNQQMFLNATVIVLLLAGLNLIRRGLVG